jgi:hypothetical protein
MTKTYSEVIQIVSFLERFEYLKLTSGIGIVTFGHDRYMNQILYQSYRWKKARREVLIRDDGHDLAHEDYPIGGSIYVHHITPLSIDDVELDRSIVYDLDNLISVSRETHQALHYGDSTKLFIGLVERKVGDTKLW